MKINIIAFVLALVWIYLQSCSNSESKLKDVVFLKLRGSIEAADPLKGGPHYTGMMVGGRHVGIEHSLDLGDLSQVYRCLFYSTHPGSCNPSGTVINPCHFCRTEVVYAVASAKCPGDESFPPSLAPLYMWVLKPYHIRKRFGHQYLCAVEPNPAAKYASRPSNESPLSSDENSYPLPPEIPFSKSNNNNESLSENTLMIIIGSGVLLTLLLCGVGLYMV
ncbi:putative secreted membrane associated signal peptide plus GPI signal [Cryptosporidium sp. chipmunk genotype I]|uniref:putative secreted membrane associated signal peptide plus GPI signal n=1 Tax=Cryptosporidium sp. chipmunk genotype I TaxID=1280935 RepID=UPI00351A68AE|nr:putative secreted membrane associated signal peptide plus GPI signal [Cryptosporidium sp. chipmunk genotype I]